MGCVSMGHCTNSLTLESVALVPVPHPTLIFMWYLPTATSLSPVSQRHDVIKKNLAQSNTETGNKLNQLVCGVSDRYRISLFPSKIKNCPMVKSPWNHRACWRKILQCTDTVILISNTGGIVVKNMRKR